MMVNIISLLVIALSGIAILFYAVYKRRKKSEEEPPYDPKKDEPIEHIRKKLFFEIPVEKIFLGYFSIVALIYLGKLIFNVRLPGLDVTVLYLSGLAFFLSVYKIAMTLGIYSKLNSWLLISLLFSLLLFVAVYNGIPVDLTDFLTKTKDYHLTVHFLGLAMGLGGTLVVDVLFTHCMRNYAISAKESVIMHLISQMIIFGLFLLLLSGTALLLLDFYAFLENPRFLMKMIAAFVVIVNGGILNLYLTPKMKKISLKEEDRGHHEKLARISFALGAVSLVSWLSAFLLAMLEDLFDLPLITLLLGYLALLGIVVAGSQLAKFYYEKKEEKENE